MASAVASNEAPIAGLLNKLSAEPSAAPGVAYYAHHPVMSVVAARRLFNSRGLQLGRKNDDEEEDVSTGNKDDVAVDDRRRARDFSGPVFFSSEDLADPSGVATTLGRLLSKLEDAARAERSSLAAPRRGWWVAKLDDDAVTLKVPMSGLGKEHVKVWVDQNTLMIKGEGDKETADKEEKLRYSRRIELPADAFKMDQVRAEMNNGLLKVTVPRVKYEER